MDWQDITLGQFQAIHRLSLQNGIDDLDKVHNVIQIIFDKTDFEVNNLTVKQFNDYAKQCSFLLIDDVPGKPKRFIRTGAKKYGIIYNPAKLKQRQYVEILSYSDNPVQNMHLIMASLVQPVRFGFWHKNNLDKHEDMAEDMLKARIIDVYHTCVFFCKLYVNSIIAMKTYLENEMIAKGVSREAAETLLQNLINVSAGFIPRSRSRNLSA